MVKLRLRRMGARNLPFYRIVAVDSGVKRDGKYIECIGHYDPKPTPSAVTIDTERAMYWLCVGAQPTDTVKSLFSKDGIIAKYAEAKAKKSEA